MSLLLGRLENTFLFSTVLRTVIRRVSLQDAKGVFAPTCFVPN